MLSRRTLIPALLTLLLLPTACGPSPRQRTAATLDDVESFINDRPDSALAVLRGMDSTALSTCALRARHSLLHTMALDKCYKDITTPGLLSPAASYYEHHGSADEKMKVFYYQGRIQQDKGDLNTAAIAYSRAETFAPQATDAHAKGLLYLAFGSVYNAVYNTQQELHYKAEGVRILEEAGDPLYDAALGELALVYHSMQEWEKADSLYRTALDHSKGNPSAMRVYSSNYARMLMLQPKPDPAKAIELFDRLLTEYEAALSVKDAGVYAYAADLLGKTKLADSLLERIESLPESQSSDAMSWLSRIALHRGNYEAAYHYLRRADLQDEAIIRASLEDSVSKALQEYYERRTDEEQKEKTQILLLSFCALLMLIIVLLLITIRKSAIERERDRLYEIRSSLIREMDEMESRYAELSDEYEKTNSELQQEKEYSLQLEAIKEEFKQERLARFRQVGRLGSTVWQRENKRIEESLAWKELKEQLNYLYQMQRGGAELVRRLDSALDGAISRMRQDLRLRGKPKEVLFLCCCILDMDPVVISDILEISVDNVYKKKSRYRAKVESLGNPEYVWLLGKSAPKGS